MEKRQIREAADRYWRDKNGMDYLNQAAQLTAKEDKFLDDLRKEVNRRVLAEERHEEERVDGRRILQELRDTVNEQEMQIALYPRNCIRSENLLGSQLAYMLSKIVQTSCHGIRP